MKQNALRRAPLAGRPARCTLRYFEDPGGANRDRTGDLLLAKQALSQLSYGPAGEIHRSGAGVHGGSGWIRTIDPRLIKTML